MTEWEFARLIEFHWNTLNGFDINEWEKENAFDKRENLK